MDQGREDILPKHLIHYQKDHSVNMSFTCRYSTLYLKAMDVVRMGHASAESFEDVFVGLDPFLVSSAPLAEKRNGLGFRTAWQTCPLGDCLEMERLPLLVATMLTIGTVVAKD